MPLDERPICAVATAPGKGAIGVVRVSAPGPGALDTIVRAVLGRSLTPRTAAYGPFLADDGSPIDYGLALWFPAPASYTGEHVLELQGHGGPVVMQRLLQRVLKAGAADGLRLAAPGEFTERAFLNDKLDLAQAEAVADLIEASTEQAARSAARSLQGVFSGLIDGIAERLLELRMLVEATLDFPEEEIEFLERANALGRLADIDADLRRTLATARQGALLRQGLGVVLVGAPNVGKSSLLNALAGADVAIVTPIAGTTRDRVSQTIALSGLPVNIVDTAGLRATDDPIERIGIERTWAAVAQADVIVRLVAAAGEEDGRQPGVVGAGEAAGEAAGEGAGGASGTAGGDPLIAQIDARAPAGTARLTVVNKIDLTAATAGVDGDTIRLSALTGEGVGLLREALAHVEAAREHGAQGDAALDLFAEELRLAHDALGQITGKVTADDLLGVIFSRFCIGK